MADEEVQQEGTGEENETNQEPQKKSKLVWILLGTIVPLCAGGGYFLGRIIAGGPDPAQEALTAEQDKEEPDYVKMLTPKAKESNTWIFPVDPVVANLMDPGARRYLRVGFFLEMNGQFDQAGGQALLTANMPKIKNWLMNYFSNLTVEQLQGEKNLNRVAVQVKDGLNELLFPDVKPLIVDALFSERAIQ